jgi:hypothetical protein
MRANLLIFLLFVSLAGCQSMMGAAPSAGIVSAAQPQAAAAPTVPRSLPATTAPADDPSVEITHQQALAAIAPDLQAIAATDPAAHQQLLTQLQTVPPAMWQVTTQQFRATLAYAAERAKAIAAIQPATVATPTIANRTPTQPLFAAPGSTAKVLQPPVSAPAPRVNQTAAEPPSTPLPPIEQPTAPLRIENQHAAPSGAQSEVRLVSAESTSPRAAERPVTTSPMPGDWRQNLDRTITQLSAAAPAQPANTAEAYDHARLRMLQLAAGKEDAAMAPIPGLPASEQGYWSKQLFAVSTMLDSASQPDVGRRAAAASFQLEEAAGQLGNVATLAVKNASFCSEILGFGAYEPLAKPQFKPGDPVKLYLEVANYRSESTAEGYHSTIDTSYRVLDHTGAVVESKEFPPIDDYCLTRRRDFHIQYETDLPTGIYPNKYKLELTLRDRLGDKLAVQTLDFEIVSK